MFRINQETLNLWRFKKVQSTQQFPDKTHSKDTNQFGNVAISRWETLHDYSCATMKFQWKYTKKEKFFQVFGLVFFTKH